MNRLTSLLAPLALVTLLGGCERRADEAMEFARPEVTTGLVMALPVTTTSADARNHFLQGVRATDMGRIVDAYQHFQMAVRADSTFAHAYLNAANTAPSLEAFRTNLAKATAHGAGATEAERILIQIAEAGFNNDVEGQVRLATQLTEVQPESPRAWLALASAQATAGNHAAARASATKAAELSPQFAPAHAFLGNSYLFNEPRDAAKAEEAMQKVVQAEPQESQSYDLLGDAYRAQGKFAEARDAYTRAAELDPTSGLALQQRGHVNSFLGDYAAARADYDSGIALGKANQAPAFATFRAFVNVHEGNPGAAINELNNLVTAIDGMNIPEPAGVKINALTNVALIALHTGDIAAAEQAISQRAALQRGQAEKVGKDEFRRSQEANIAIFEGWLAARKGDVATASKKIEEYTKLVAPDANPQKMQPAHELMGLVSFEQKKYREAVAHFRQGDLDNPYTKYYLARAYEGAGNTAEAKKLYGEVANYNFNNVTIALTRKEAMEKR